jgi:glutaredoxin 2
MFSVRKNGGGSMADSLKIEDLELKSLVVLMYRDLQEFKAETKTNFQEFKAETKTNFQEIKAETNANFQVIGNDVQEIRNDLNALDKRVAVIETRTADRSAVFFSILAVLTIFMPVVCVVLQHWLVG